MLTLARPLPPRPFCSPLTAAPKRCMYDGALNAQCPVPGATTGGRHRNGRAQSRRVARAFRSEQQHSAGVLTHFALKIRKERSTFRREHRDAFSGFRLRQTALSVADGNARAGKEIQIG